MANTASRRTCRSNSDKSLDAPGFSKNLGSVLPLRPPTRLPGCATERVNDLLVLLSTVIARQRQVSAISEVAKHLTAAAAVLLVSRAIGAWIPAHLG